MKNLFLFILVAILSYKTSEFLFKGRFHLPEYLDFIQYDKQMKYGDTIHLYGLGKYDAKKILIVKNTIEKRCHLPIVIEKPIEIKNVDYQNNNLIDLDKYASIYDDSQNKILISDFKGYSSSENRSIGGVGEFEGNIIIISKNPTNTIERVLIHELGHCFGLYHCSSKFCAMSPNRKDDNLKLNYCEECKSKL